MQKEYKILEVKICDAETKMNDMAKHDWEVISTDIYSAGPAMAKAKTPVFITFAREIGKSD